MLGFSNAKFIKCSRVAVAVLFFLAKTRETTEQTDDYLFSCSDPSSVAATATPTKRPPQFSKHLVFVVCFSFSV